MHHKAMIVDGRYLYLGSFNYSSSGNNINFENIVRIDAASGPDRANVVLTMLDEYNTLWNSDLVLPPGKARKMHNNIIKFLSDNKIALAIREALDKQCESTPDDNYCEKYYVKSTKDLMAPKANRQSEPVKKNKCKTSIASIKS